MVKKSLLPPLNTTVSWLRQESFHSFFKVIGQSESAQKMVG
jgi:hypothetical protein